MNLQRGPISGGVGGNSFSREIQIITSSIYWERTPGLHGKRSPANPGVTWCPLAIGLILGFIKPHFKHVWVWSFCKEKKQPNSSCSVRRSSERERGAEWPRRLPLLLLSLLSCFFRDAVPGAVAMGTVWRARGLPRHVILLGTKEMTGRGLPGCRSSSRPCLSVF